MKINPKVHELELRLIALSAEIRSVKAQIEYWEKHPEAAETLHQEEQANPIRFGGDKIEKW